MRNVYELLSSYFIFNRPRFCNSTGVAALSYKPEGRGFDSR
jgi:hypothetical protein